MADKDIVEKLYKDSSRQVAKIIGADMSLGGDWTAKTIAFHDHAVSESLAMPHRLAFLKGLRKRELKIWDEDTMLLSIILRNLGTTLSSPGFDDWSVVNVPRMRGLYGGKLFVCYCPHYLGAGLDYQTAYTNWFVLSNNRATQSKTVAAKSTCIAIKVVVMNDKPVITCRLGWYECLGQGCYGSGDTPETAYQNWVYNLNLVNYFNTTKQNVIRRHHDRSELYQSLQSRASK